MEMNTLLTKEKYIGIYKSLIHEIRKKTIKLG